MNIRIIFPIFLIICILLAVANAAALRDPGNVVTISSPAGLLNTDPVQGSGIIPSIRTPVSDDQWPVMPSLPDLLPIKKSVPSGTLIPDDGSQNRTPVPTESPVVKPGPGAYAPGRVIVKYKDIVATPASGSKNRIAAANSAVGATVLEDFSDAGIPGMQVVKVSGISVPDAVNQYNNLSIVEYAEPDYLLYISDEGIISANPGVPQISRVSGVITASPSIPGVRIPPNPSVLQNPPLVAKPPVSGIPGGLHITTAPTPAATISTGETDPLLAPLSVEFLQYMNTSQRNTRISGENTGGFIPSPVNSTHLKGKHLSKANAAYPASFDLRNSNKVTSVKNQGQCGSCWAHGTYGSLESVMMPSANDFSENNLKNTHGFDWGPCDGGNNYISMAYLGRWDGPVAESADPYRPDTTPSTPNLPVSGHVQDVIQLPQKGNPLDNDNIKWALSNYGGVSASYYHSDNYYSSANKAYYYPSDTYANHIITIVGWDDNYLKSNFNTIPAGNGAFLCKNSWGTGWGQSGYFWISYYDLTLGYDELFVFLSAASPSNYARVYQYDPLGWVFDFGYGTSTGYLANIFTATASEQLTAVGFYTPDMDCQYEIKVYTGSTGGPTSGTLRQTFTGFIEPAGYHTVNIPAVSLTANEKFSVVLRVTTTGYGYPIAIEYPYSGYSSGARASSGQSYYSSNGVSFTDISSRYANTNVCLKAFTTANGSPTPTVTSTPTPTGTPTATPTTTTTPVPTPTQSPGTDRIPNDPSFGSLWGLHNTGQTGGTSDADIDAPAAWSVITGSSSVIIAVIDTGVDYNHPDLAANMWTNTGEIAGNGVDDDNNGYVDDVRGWNFYSKTNNPMDDNSHGTHCAGTIAGVGNNGLGVTGVSWTAKIMPLKFLSSGGSGYTSDAVAAILYANRMGAHILSNSWGGGGFSQSLKDAIDASPAVVVCAAGNSGLNTDTSPHYPSAYTSSNIIAVAATDNNDNLASFSNYGVSSVDVGAPGVSIYSTTPSSGYGTKSGTSMATPHVSGLAGLVKSANPSLTKIQIRDAILTSTDAKSSLSGKVATGGRINAARAVNLVYVPTLEARFYGIPGTTVFPLTIQFRDASIGNPTRWTWAFGDGGSSTDQHPSHTYTEAGAYTVTLTVQS